jgi:ribosomal protein S18 acetylase RimI-like enzyme
MKISLAHTSDLETVQSIIEEAGSWLRSRGINQWSPGTPIERRLRQLLTGSCVYLVYFVQEPVATITLQESDETIWGTDDNRALYVHLLAIRRAIGGKGIGKILLNWAAAQGRQKGKEFLRLDCWADNPALCRYYESAGFLPKGQVQLNHWRAMRYEIVINNMRAVEDSNE